MSIATQQFDHIDAALTTYKQLRTDVGDGTDELFAPGAQNWIVDHVCPVVERLTNDLRFQKHAVWPLAVLGRGAHTPERRLIDEIDRGIVDLACALTDSEDETEYDGGDAVRVCDRDIIDTRDESSLSRSMCIRRAHQAAARPWIDFVAPTDYFDPHHGLHLVKPLPDESIDEFSAWGIPRYCDFLTRLLIGRIDFWLRPLSKFMHIWPPLFPGTDDSQYRELLRCEVALQRMRNELLELVYTKRIGSLPEACISLTLVYAHHHPSPTLDWLVPAEIVEHVRLFTRAVGEQFSWDRDSLDRVARAVETCAIIYRDPPDRPELIRHASHNHRLVLDVLSETVYWRGNQVAIKLTAHEWLFFAVLVESQKYLEKAIDRRDLGKDFSYGYFKKLKSAVCRKLRSVGCDLWEAIVTNGDARRLDVPSNEIRVFSSQDRQEIWELVSLESPLPSRVVSPRL